MSQEFVVSTPFAVPDGGITVLIADGLELGPALVTGSVRVHLHGIGVAILSLQLTAPETLDEDGAMLAVPARVLFPATPEAPIAAMATGPFPVLRDANLSLHVEALTTVPYGQGYTLRLLANLLGPDLYNPDPHAPLAQGPEPILTVERATLRAIPVSAVRRVTLAAPALATSTGPGTAMSSSGAMTASDAMAGAGIEVATRALPPVALPVTGRDLGIAKPVAADEVAKIFPSKVTKKG